MTLSAWWARCPLSHWSAYLPPHAVQCRIQSIGANYRIGRYGLPLEMGGSARILALEQMEVTCLGCLWFVWCVWLGCVVGVCASPVCCIGILPLPQFLRSPFLGPATRRTARACHELTPLTFTLTLVLAMGLAVGSGCGDWLSGYRTG